MTTTVDMATWLREQTIEAYAKYEVTRQEIDGETIYWYRVGMTLIAAIYETHIVRAWAHCRGNSHTVEGYYALDYANNAQPRWEGDIPHILPTFDLVAIAENEEEEAYGSADILNALYSVRGEFGQEAYATLKAIVQPERQGPPTLAQVTGNWCPFKDGDQ